MSNTDGYSVWVGGGEVNDHTLTYSQASILAEIYKEHGYTDVAVERVTVNEYGEITCVCSNVPRLDGFTVCHKDGTPDTTLYDLDSTRPVFYRCDHCGAIIEETTLRVV